MEHLALPRGAVAKVHAAALNIPEEALCIGRVDAPAAKPLVCKWKQSTKHKLRDRDLAHPWPVQASVDPVTGSDVEVLFCRRERHLGPHGQLLLGEHAARRVV